MISDRKMNRRQFMTRSGLATAAYATSSSLAFGAHDPDSTPWQIGCFNRPWGKWSYDEALDEIQSAGFTTTGLVGRHQKEPEDLLSADASADYLDALRDRIAQRDLKPIIAWIYGPKAKEQKDAVSELKKLTDNAARLGLEFLLSGGPRRNETVDYYSSVISEVTAYAADKGVKIAMKPHGGDGAEILRCIELVNHPNFSIWYDAGNIVYYTGGNPVDELKGIAPYVTGFCAKDCVGKETPVMIQFGTGKANFAEVFQVLKNADFKGPVMIECTGEPESPQDATRMAVENRDFLKEVFSNLK